MLIIFDLSFYDIWHNILLLLGGLKRETLHIIKLKFEQKYITGVCIHDAKGCLY